MSLRGGDGLDGVAHTRFSIRVVYRQELGGMCVNAFDMCVSCMYACMYVCYVYYVRVHVCMFVCMYVCYVFM